MTNSDSTAFPFDDTADFDAVTRGLIDSGEPVVRDANGEVVWDNGSYTSFLTGDSPESVHPSLWRQSTLVATQGLFEVTDGIYQVRGYDLSNMTIVEGDTGVIVIDPADQCRDRGGRPGSVPQASWRSPGRRSHPHPQPRGPLRRGQGGDQPGGRRRRRGRRSSRPRVSSSTRSRRTCTPAPRWGGGPATCMAQPFPVARKAVLGLAWDRPPRPGRSPCWTRR